MKVVVSFSGGKDSQACLIEAAKKYGVSNIEAVFCDTGCDYSLATAGYGSRLCCKNSELATYFGEQFIDIWNKILLK